MTPAVPGRRGGVERADALTRVIADRVAELRKPAGYNQAQLGERMAELRPGWSRSTVVKLENYNRESVSVADLIALAVALGVPPVSLIVDPRSKDPSVIGQLADEQDVWQAILWFNGRVPHLREVGGAWVDATAPIERAAHIYSLIFRLYRTEDLPELIVSDPVDDAEAREQLRTLTALQKHLNSMKNQGYAIPVVPNDIRGLAAERGVELPEAGE